MSKKIIKKETEEISQPVNKKAIFAGAQSLMSKPQSPKETSARKLIMLVSQALNINPFGINILGDLPYVNNNGKKDKLAQYCKTATFEYKWIKRAMDDVEKAICEARVVNNGKPMCDWVVGECSPKTIKMGPLQGYQNHMAQTRAENRAFEAAYGNKMRLELFENVQKLMTGGLTTPDLAAKALNAGSTSYEEAVDLNKQTPNYTSVPESKKIDMEKVKTAIGGMGEIDVLYAAKERIENSKNYTDAQKVELKKLIDSKIEKIFEN